MKRGVVAMVLLLGIVCAGCVASGPRSGELGKPVPAPWGWYDYLYRGGR